MKKTKKNTAAVAIAAAARLAGLITQKAVAHGPDMVLARGTLFFLEEFTELDRLTLTCFNEVRLASEMPNWDEAGHIGSIDFTLPDLYAFSGRRFFTGVRKMLGATAPSEEAVSRRAAELSEVYRPRGSAYAELAKEALQTAGVSEHAAGHIGFATQYPVEPEDVVAMLRGIPLPFGLIAMRLDYTEFGDGYSIKKDNIAVGGYSFEVPEDWFGRGCGDQEIVRTFAKGDTDALAVIVAAAIGRGFRSSDVVGHSELLERIGRKLIALAARPDGTVGSEMAPQAG